MAPNTTNNTSNTLSLRSVLDKDKLNHTNFLDWFRNLRIVLKHEKKLYVLDEPVPEEPAATPKAAHDAWVKHFDDSVEVSCLMLTTMIAELQKDLEHLDAYEIIKTLKDMFQQQARQERFETVRALHGCMMKDGDSVSAHVIKMKSHLDHLERLGAPVSNELATDLILNSLPKSFDSFVLNYNMNGWDKTISELHSMLKTAEKNVPKKPSMALTIQEGNPKKPKTNRTKANSAKRKGKQVAPTPSKKRKVPKDDVCHECGIKGHWKRNCPKYLAQVKAKKAGEGTSGIPKE